MSQLPEVNVSDPGETVDSPVSLEVIEITTFEIGSEFKTTVNVSVEPSSPFNFELLVSAPRSFHSIVAVSTPS